MRAILRAAAERAGWGESLPEGLALGIACSSDGGTVVAKVAEISLDLGSGQIRVHRVVVAFDPGRTINPDGARAQIEGSIVMGTSAPLLKEITIKHGRIQAGDLDRYPPTEMAQSPDVEIVLFEAPDGKPRGWVSRPLAMRSLPWQAYGCAG